MMGGGILFALWVLFPPKNTLARIEFTSDRVRFIPNLIARSIGEQSEETVISPQSAEILICHRLVNGYRIIVRETDGAERELASHSPHALVNLKESEINSMAEAITPATGLPSAWSFGGDRPPERSKRRPGRRPPQKESR
jgi:hypothetical protein